jgi:cyclopropane-fatty-acyl-phospholipid synthase
MSKWGLAQVFQRLVDPVAPMRFRAYDGSAAGPADAPVELEIRSPRAVQYLVTSPGELGLARAYVTGNLAVNGDIYVALSTLAEGSEKVTPQQRARLLATMGPRFLRRVEPPPEELRPRARRGWRHSKSRDSAAISHHYDVSNRFYGMVLGPSMTYTCACYPYEGASLEQAQANKHELVSRKLALQPGMRLLDVGCGWGGMVMHAAEHHGVQALGVTLSRQQAEWARKAIAERGLTDRAEVRHSDYRDVTENGFDAVSSIGLTEHIGAANLSAYFRFLYGKLRPGGRLLNHCITRPRTFEPHRAGKFIDRYVFPDGELEAVGTIVSAMQDSGFEVRHEENLREHYARTLRDWCGNLETHWDEAVREVGENRARVWLLYMAASRLGFDRHYLELHQALGVRLGERGVSGMPLRPDW